MERKQLDEKDLGKIVGGSIIFNEDLTTCGRNCNNQYKVLDFNAILDFVNKNSGKMPEKQMMSKMLELGYIANL